MPFKILVADDEPSTLDYVKGILKQEGYEVATVQSGEQALEELRTVKYDLLLTDCVMGNMDGYRLAAIVSGNEYTCRAELGKVFEGYSAFVKKYKDLPMLLMSTSITSLDKEMFIAVGGRDVIPKSKIDSELVEKIRQYLHP